MDSNKITVRGPFSQSGFGVACVGLIKVLQTAGYSVAYLPINTNPDQHEVGFSDKLKGELQQISEPIDSYVADSILIDVGSLIYGLTVPKADCKKHILYCTTETTDIHPEYVQMMNDKYDEIWTATNFNKVGFMSSGVETNVKVLPHLIDTDKFSPDAPPLKIKGLRGFNFIVNVDLSFRKGIHYLIPAFLKTFEKDDDVALVCKITNGSFKNSKAAIDAMNELLFQHDVKNDTNHAPILFMFGMLSDTYMPGLYTTGQCYVSPNLGEGFGLPIAESMACGLAQIVTRCGGPLDYVNKKSGYYIALDEKNPTQPIQDMSLLHRDPHYQGRSIFNLNPESLEEQLRYAYINQEETKTKGATARERIIKKCSLPTLAEKVKTLLT